MTQSIMKNEFLNLIDSHKNQLIEPVEMLKWTWLRVFILQIPEDEFIKYMNMAEKVCS